MSVYGATSVQEERQPFGKQTQFNLDLQTRSVNIDQVPRWKRATWTDISSQLLYLYSCGGVAAHSEKSSGGDVGQQESKNSGRFQRHQVAILSWK
ncbi:hypothetical protein SERLA73DRAFT_180107 [Serpula lacrymans var. lacrymans S7.3]|uniref:Uncharacterized protein n=2 Tax=Serpula lacrymans var. lacrymans TaxID=341189 RepID=F8PW01_SERL3|nr:uncharacterized protein SERLADRAFT_465564 [Serpula lacrymans var. lacrymans S7.9]EGN99860.1 hypothetical protein SERLA73DRAFT_180107 [Serpula lacrymans var. lacrymans S7.3]EGO25429.1 hypothetical protein SERLADRAFT_465564 [Serpula lacrymans var. lacrymans S7.9]